MILDTVFIEYEPETHEFKLTRKNGEYYLFKLKVGDEHCQNFNNLFRNLISERLNNFEVIQMELKKDKS